MCVLSRIFGETQTLAGSYELALEPACLQLGMDEVVVALGYPAGGMDPYFADVAASLLCDLPDLCRPRATYCVLELASGALSDDSLRLGVHALSIGRIISSQLAQSTSVALFACTIGSGLERLAAQSFAEGDPIAGHLADLVASLAAEALAALVHGHIQASLEKGGLGVTERYSPGYCGWPVSDQGKLFALLGEGACGISLSESSLMAPIKSVSALLGCGVGASRHPYRCGACGQSDCIYPKRREMRGGNK